LHLIVAVPFRCLKVGGVAWVDERVRAVRIIVGLAEDRFAHARNVARQETGVNRPHVQGLELPDVRGIIAGSPWSQHGQETQAETQTHRCAAALHKRMYLPLGF
jgi:hypothetical protein